MRFALSLALALLVGCGSAPPPLASHPAPEHHEATIAPPRFASHLALTLRSDSTATSPPLYAELGADGSITGTRCGATRFTDEGALERDSVVIASVRRDDDGLAVYAGDRDTGWRIADRQLSTSAETRFELATDTIMSDDPQVPPVRIDPPTAPHDFALVFFAELLICADLGP